MVDTPKKIPSGFPRILLNSFEDVNFVILLELRKRFFGVTSIFCAEIVVQIRTNISDKKIALHLLISFIEIIYNSTQRPRIYAGMELEFLSAETVAKFIIKSSCLFLLFIRLFSAQN